MIRKRPALLGPLASAVALSLGLGSASGCVEKSKDLSAAEREQLRPFVSTSAPTPQHPLDISFQDQLRLVGYDVSAETWKAGEKQTITWYWKCEKALDDGWLLFTHVDDAGGRSVINLDGEGALRRLYPPGRWKAGEYLKDVQEVTLPADWASDKAVFYLGAWKGAQRLHVTRGPNDGEDRARALSIPTTPATAAAEAPRPDDFPKLRASKAAGPIRLDGVLDEPSWGTADRTPPFVDTMSGEPADPRSSVRVLWDADNLYVAFEIADDHLKSAFRRRDDHLWEQDAAEVMVDFEGDGRNYFELQVSPRNVAFDTRYDTRRQPQPFGHMDWNSGVRSGVKVDGTVDDGDADRGYVVEMAIPWQGFAIEGTPLELTPTHGATLRANFYVLDAREEGQRGVGWSAPRVGDFHVPARFGQLTLVDPAAAPVVPTGVDVHGGHIPSVAPGTETPSNAAVPPKGSKLSQPLLRLPPHVLERLRQARTKQPPPRPGSVPAPATQPAP